MSPSAKFITVVQKQPFSSIYPFFLWCYIPSTACLSPEADGASLTLAEYHGLQRVGNARGSSVREHRFDGEGFIHSLSLARLRLL